MLSTIGCMVQKKGYSIFVSGNPAETEFVEWNYHDDGVDAESAGYITDDYVKMNAPTTGSCTLISKSTINFSQYKKAKVRFKVSMEPQHSNLGFTLDLRLYDSQPVVGSDTPSYSQHVVSDKFMTAGTYEVEFDISSFTATKYPGLRGGITYGGGYVDVYEWRLLR